MAIKKYNFNKILKEYSTLYHIDYMLSKAITKVVIAQDGNTFRVTYSSIDYPVPQNDSLEGFLYYKVSTSISYSNFKRIILDKENKNLNLQIVIWPPTKIRYAYLYTNYAARDIGRLGKSCMRNKEMQKSLNFYIKNNVRIVVVIDNTNKIHARALLWGDVKNTANKKIVTYLDRIYTKSDNILSLYHKLTEENKWSSYGSSSSRLYIDNLNIKGMCHLPYTDTFRCLYYKNNVVSSSTLPKGTKLVNADYYVSLTHTGEGGYHPNLDPNRVQEVFTRTYISKKDAIKVKKYDGYVLKKNIANINGDYYSKYDKKIVESKLDGYILVVNAVSEVLTGEKIDKTKATHSTKYKGYLHSSNAVEIKDEIYHKKDDNIICFNGRWYHISQCFINYDMKEVNKELAKHSLQLSGNFLPYWARTGAWDTNKGAGIMRKDTPLPKEQAIIAYNIICNGQSREDYATFLAKDNSKFSESKFLKTCSKDIFIYQKVYCKNKEGLLRLNTGEMIVNKAENRKYLKKFNNKWYIKQDFKLPDKKQLTFNFEDKL